MSIFYFDIQIKSIKGHRSVVNCVFDSVVAEGSRTNDQLRKFDHRILRVSRNLCVRVCMCTCVSSAEVCNQAC